MKLLKENLTHPPLHNFSFRVEKVMIDGVPVTAEAVVSIDMYSVMKQALEVAIKNRGDGTHVRLLKRAIKVNFRETIQTG